MYFHTILLYFIYWANHYFLCQCQTTTFLYSEIYQELIPTPCYRRGNASSIYGCQEFSSQGVLYGINSMSDLNTFLISAPASQNYVVVIASSLISRPNLQALENSSKVAGILLSNVSVSPFDQQNYSHDSVCPGCQFGLYPDNQYPWNPTGQDILQDSIEFPIFGSFPLNLDMISDENVINYGTGFNKNRTFSDFPLYSAEFTSLMTMANNSITCLRRGTCSPVGGLSVYSLPRPVSAVKSNKKPLVLATAKMDADALVPDLAVGASSHVSGMVALMAAIDVLAKNSTLSNYPNDIAVAIFNAQTSGFSGSKRFVKDIIQASSLSCSSTSSPTNNACPLSNAVCYNPCFQDFDYQVLDLENIVALVEVGPVGGIHSTTATNQLFIHVDNSSTSSPSTAVMNTILSASGSNTSKAYNSAVDTVNNKLPPSSIMSFLAALPNLPAVYIAEFKSAFINTVYGTALDDQSGYSVSHGVAICDVATSLARSLWMLGNNQTDPTLIPTNLTANCQLVDQLMNCLLNEMMCDTVLFLNNETTYYEIPGRISHFSGAFNFMNPSTLSLFVYNYFANLFSYNVTGACSLNSPCSNNGDCINNTCHYSFTRFHFAYGTGIEMNYGSGLFEVIDPRQPTFTISGVQQLGLRTFYVSSLSIQLMEFFVGVGMVGISFLISYFGKKKILKRLHGMNTS